MTPERWQRVKQIFDGLAERSASERATALDAAVAGDADLRAAVERLLRAHDAAEAEAFIERPAPVAADVVPPVPEETWHDEAGDGALAAAAEADARHVGRILGPYRLVALIGRGGMGSVFRAERGDDPARRPVALKIVRQWDESAWARERFAGESRILASLDHPHVARFIDAGETPEGLPFLVMDLVEGLPLTEYARVHALTVADRVRLFRDVCAAVHYLHQNLVVHRDLKPANVLVTAAGVPKLLDFGIAKLLDPGPGTALPTATLLRALTPDYASPEQVRGEPVTTASDVYSLGAVLYELLTGRRPHRLAAYTPAEVARAVCTDLPERPSSVAARLEAMAAPAQGAVTRVTPRRRLRRQLEGDLDTIVMTALRKEPERRYRSVDQLADDLRRYLERQPISARPDTLRYRAAKFVRRNPGASAAAVLLAASIVGGTGITAYLAHQARRERESAQRRLDDVRALAKSVLFEVHDAVRGLPGSAPARALIAERLRDYLQRLARDAGDDPELQLELAAAYAKVAEVERALERERSAPPR